jgi:twinkle protein
VKTFADYSIEIYGARSGNVKTLCPQCSHTRTKKTDPCLSVDIDKGVWHCHNCAWSGGLPPESEPRPQVVQAAPTAPKPQPITPSVLAWFAARGIGEATCRAFDVQSITVFSHGQQARVEHAALPFYEAGKIVNWKYRSLGTKDFSQSKGGKQVSFNIDAIQHGLPVVITEGELDCMAVHEAGITNVISCPCGAPAIGTKNYAGKLAFLDDERTKQAIDAAPYVVLAMDADDTGVAWREVIASHIGPERCRLVAWSADCKDANDVLLSYGPEVVRECIDIAPAMPVAGIDSYGAHEADIMAYMQTGGGAKGVDTGWRCVDELMRLQPGQLMVVTGIPQSGKSEWLDALMLNTMAKHQWKWAVFSPENHPIEFHFQKLAEKLTGLPMFCQHAGQRCMSVADAKAAIAALDSYVYPLTFDEDGTSVDELLRRLKVCVVRHGVKGFILDPYNEVEHSRASNLSETEYISSFLSKIRNFGRKNGVLMCIVAHPTKLKKKRDNNGNEINDYPVPTLYDINGSAHWRNKADIGIAIWRDLAKGGNGVQVHVQKMRNKNLGHVGMATLFWDWKNGRFQEQQIQ